jgi:immunity protein 8 of polymorphic toxin system
MIYPQVRRIYSPDLDPPDLPEDPSDCEIFFRVFIGPADGEGEEAFSFAVVTPTRFSKGAEARWGRGKLIVPVFEWSIVAQAIAKLLAQAACPTWGEVVAELNKELVWEFDGHKPTDA